MNIPGKSDVLEDIRRHSNDGKYLYRILIDETEFWTELECQSEESIIREKDCFSLLEFDLQDYLEAYDRVAVVTAAKQLQRTRYRLQPCNAVAARLEVLSDSVSGATKAFAGKSLPEFTQSLLRRLVDALSWLLGLNLREIRKLGIDPMEVIDRLSIVAVDPYAENAVKYVQKLSVFLKNALPIPADEAAPITAPVPSSVFMSERAMKENFYGLLTLDGYRLISRSSGHLATVTLPDRLWSILGVAWCCQWLWTLDESKGSENSPLHLMLHDRALRPILGKTYSRTNISHLSRTIWSPLGDRLITKGPPRSVVTEFILDDRDWRPNESFTVYVQRFMAQKGWDVDAQSRSISRAQK